MQNLLSLIKDLTLHPKNISELNGLILQLAIQGKLTANWRANHPELVSGSNSASALLKQIQAEKEQLIKEKKIKKEKDYPDIFEEEIPFELPEGWRWCRLGSISEKLGAGSTPLGGKSAYVDKGIKFLRSQNIYNDGLRLQSVALIDLNTHEKMSGTHVRSNDLLLNITGGSIGRCSLVPDNFDTANVSQHVAIVRMINVSTRNYIHSLITSELFQKTIMDVQVGVSREGLSMTKLKQFLVPFPPLEEQKAIVSTVDELFKEVDELAEQVKFRTQLKEDYVTSACRQLTENTQATWRDMVPLFPEFFDTKPNIKKLRETILQLAVQGKLSASWRNSHPELISGSNSAQALLEKIKAEKEQLIEEKKINGATVRREKPLPEITEDEIPYELPDGWEWCRMQEVGLFERGKSKHRPRNDVRLFSNGRYPLVQTGDVSDAKKNSGIIRNHKSAYNDFGLSQSRMWKKGTLCITIAANIAETGVLGFDACFPDSVVGFTNLVDGYTSRYVDYYITVMKSDLEKFAPSTAQKNINLGVLFELMFPLPPLSEQKAIVEKVKSLIALCDQLEEAVETSESRVLDLMKSVVREATESDKTSKVSMRPYKDLGGFESESMAAEPAPVDKERREYGG